MYPENPEGTQLIVGSMNMGYIIYIWHCQESNSQPVLFQAEANLTSEGQATVTYRYALQ